VTLSQCDTKCQAWGPHETGLYPVDTPPCFWPSLPDLISWTCKEHAQCQRSCPQIHISLSHSIMAHPPSKSATMRVSFLHFTPCPFERALSAYHALNKRNTWMLCIQHLSERSLRMGMIRFKFTMSFLL